jgi:ribonuclease-3
MASENKNVPENDPLEDCQKAIGYQFNQIDLLKSALTHASGVDSRLASNERLEFLGDSILGLICCEYLYHRFPDLQEGDMTKIKSVVVSRPTCAKVSEDLKLGSFMVLGRGVAYNIQHIPHSVYYPLTLSVHWDKCLVKMILHQLSSELIKKMFFS